MLSAVLFGVLKVIIYSIRLAPGNALAAWGGLIQRLAFFIWLGWQFTIAMRLHTLTKEAWTGALPEYQRDEALQHQRPVAWASRKEQRHREERYNPGTIGAPLIRASAPSSDLFSAPAPTRRGTCRFEARSRGRSDLRVDPRKRVVASALAGDCDFSFFD